MPLPYYECVFIARQDVSSPVAEALADQFTKILEDNGGRVANREYWGLRSMCFRIRKNRKGHYILLNIDAPPAAVHEMERQMRINEDVIRTLTIRVDALKPGPSAVMQNRSARGDERHRRDDRFRGERPPRGDSEDAGSERRRNHGD
jgi:small subunit ribosomal protein S6